MYDACSVHKALMARGARKKVDPFTLDANAIKERSYAVVGPKRQFGQTQILHLTPTLCSPFQCPHAVPRYSKVGRSSQDVGTLQSCVPPPRLNSQCLKSNKKRKLGGLHPESRPVQ